MEVVVWNREQQLLVLAAMAQVMWLEDEHPPSELDKTLLDATARHVFGLEGVPPRLPEVSPRALANALSQQDERARALLFLTLAVYIEMEVEAARACVVDRYAAEFGIASDAVTNMRRLRDGQILRLKLDYGRKLLAAGFLPGDGILGTLKAVVDAYLETRGDEAVASRFRALEKLPDGTLGKSYFQFYETRGFLLPGEKGAYPEALFTVHDASHLLGGFNTDPAGEIAVGAFTAGYAGRHASEVLLDGIAAFHLGIMLDPPLDIRAARGQMDPDLMMQGLACGAVMTRDLMDGWDYWAAFERPIVDVREELGIVGAADVWLDSPNALGDKRRSPVG
ncbi:MAG: hypothetical protein P8R42_08060 [Candidatus Binatia bacterium]|nr:hypothetical protein [Candidatus Binatia bacterium]